MSVCATLVKQTTEPTKQSNLQIATPADNFTMTSLKKALINTGELASYTPFSSRFSHNKNIQSRALHEEKQITPSSLEDLVQHALLIVLAY